MLKGGAFGECLTFSECFALCEGSPVRRGSPTPPKRDRRSPLLATDLQSSDPKSEIGTSASDDRHHANGAATANASNPGASNLGQRSSAGVLPDSSPRRITAEKRRIEPSIESTRRSQSSTEKHGIARKKRIARTDCHARFLGITTTVGYLIYNNLIFYYAIDSQSAPRANAARNAPFQTMSEKVRNRSSLRAYSAKDRFAG
jgi:hypothetical protein